MLKSVSESMDAGAVSAASEIIRLSGASGMLTGQASDKENENAAEQNIEILRYIHKHKTADMLEAAVIAGACIANADEQTISRLRAFSNEMGILFQITDDLLDVTGDSARMGKTLGKDSAEGKLTYVSIFGIEGARSEADKAAARAKNCLNGIENTDMLCCFIDNMLKRSN